MIRGPFDRSRASIGHVGKIVQSANDAHREIVMNLHLAGESHIVGTVFDPLQSDCFWFCFRSGITFEYFDSTGRTTGIAAAPVQDIDPGILDRQYEATTWFCMNRFFFSFDSDDRHRIPSQRYSLAIHWGKPSRAIFFSTVYFCVQEMRS